jgi:multidrug efflux pump subunit AcrB
LLSLVYALFLIPIPAARLLKGQRAEAPGQREDEAGALGRLYERVASRALASPLLVIGGAALLAIAGTLLYFRLETGFLPEMDEGGYVVDYWTPEGTSLQESDRMVRQIEDALKTTPEVLAFTRRTGSEMGMFATEQNRGDILVRLKARSQRSRTADEVIAEQRERFSREAPGMTIEFVQLLQDMLGDLQGTPESIEVKIFGDDTNVLSDVAARLEQRLSKIDGLVDLVGPRKGNPELSVRIDPTRAAKAGFTAEDVSSQLATGLLGRVATEVRRADRLINLRVRYPDRYRFDPSWIREYPLVTAAGGVVPLSAAAEVEESEGTAQLHREDLKQMVPITGRLEGRDMGSVISDVRKVLSQERLPVGYTTAIGGQYESQQESFRSLLLVLAIAVLLVFGLLIAQFRRVSAAVVIMSAAPLSLVGAFGLLLLTGTPLNVSSFMGLILLVGLIVKNGIILIDYADRLESTGLDQRTALVRAGAIRLRPILMTTLCTLFGLLPLALGLGAGAELQKPLAVAVIGGLSVSTIVTLIFVPTALVTLSDRGPTRPFSSSAPASSPPPGAEPARW